LKEQVFKHTILDYVIPEDGEFHHNSRLDLKSHYTTTLE
jgi:hypothetical protein